MTKTDKERRAETDDRTRSERSFPLGRIVMTANAKDRVSPVRIYVALTRHAECDWGDGDKRDQKLNDQALQDGGRIFSVYHFPGKLRLWVITEWDRSYTTVMLPEDY